MDFFDEPVQAEVRGNARPALLHLMRNHHPSHAKPVAWLEAVDAYLRLNGRDAEVLEARDRLLVVEGERAGP